MEKVFCAAIVNGATLRETGVTLPCRMKGAGDPVSEQSFIAWVQNIRDQMAYFKSRCENFARKMLLKYCVEPTDFSYFNLPYLSATHTAVENFRSNFNHNDPSFLEKMRFHYNILNELASYVEQLLPSDESCREESQNKPCMEALQRDIYASMCSLKMALRSQNQDPITRVPGGKVSDIFMKHKNGMLLKCHRQWLEYIIVSDSLRLATYLETMYESF